VPLYDYHCQDCDLFFEARHRMNFTGPVACPRCSGNRTSKVISSPAIVMNWFMTEAIHDSIRFRPAAVNRTLVAEGGKQP